MKRFITFALLAVFAMAMTAEASKTRVKTLGDNNNILRDEANIWEFPSTINWYPNLVVAEIGWDDYYYDNFRSDAAGSAGDGYYGDINEFGAHWRFGSEERPWVLGTYGYNSQYRDIRVNPVGIGMALPFRYPAPDLSGWFALPDDPSGNTASNQRLGLFYGRPLGNMKFGFNLNFLGASCKSEAQNFNPEISTSQFDLNFGLSEANQQWDAALGVSLLSWKYIASNGADLTKPGSNMTIWGNYRYFHVVNPQWTLVPHVGVVLGSFEGEVYNGAAPTNVLVRTEKYSITNFNLGSGWHWTPSEGALVIADAGVSFFNSKYTVDYAAATPADEESKITVLTLPFLKMGFEGQVFDWMVVRFGQNTYWHNFKSEDVIGNFKDSYNWPDNATYLGFGLEFGRLSVDLNTHPELFLRGLNFISGTQNFQMNNMISAVYKLW